MFRYSRKLRVSTNGVLQIVDPDIGDLSFLQSIDPDYRIKTALLPGFTTPRFLLAMVKKTPLLKEKLPYMTKDALEEIHEKILKEITKADSQTLTNDDASLLDIKIELARRELMKCESNYVAEDVV
ncbi:hypothetical protein KKE26_07555 [bacterium]|nr:hypothetical protein [bacterium]MBU1753092.1 hypothetical protein [bacterium]